MGFAAESLLLEAEEILGVPPLRPPGKENSASINSFDKLGIALKKVKDEHTKACAAEPPATTADLTNEEFQAAAAKTKARIDAAEEAQRQRQLLRGVRAEKEFKAAAAKAKADEEAALAEIEKEEVEEAIRRSLHQAQPTAPSPPPAAMPLSAKHTTFLKRGQGTSRFAHGGMAEARKDYITRHNITPTAACEVPEEPEPPPPPLAPPPPTAPPPPDAMEASVNLLRQRAFEAQLDQSFVPQRPLASASTKGHMVKEQPSSCPRSSFWL